MENEWANKILAASESNFEELAFELFSFQYANNSIYRSFAELINREPRNVTQLRQIPFLPIRFFKSHSIQTTEFDPQVVFESSGTTQTVNSLHRVKDVEIYRRSFINGFEFFYGPVHNWCIIGLLPSYLERKNSSLVFMVDELMKQSQHPLNGFYLNEWDKLATTLQQLEKNHEQTLLIGVSFALLDFAEQHQLNLKNTVVMETGGMKGRREELIRKELHEKLRKAFGVKEIHSEYGMTELLSQAYSKADGIFSCPPWMKVLVRDEEDPFNISHSTFSNSSPLIGVINVIDLANIFSCSFIATDDAGWLYPDGSFEILGRVDNSDVRGCSLMVV
ncbi:MAG: acyl transferase [Chitinophagaceae bacterium]